MLDEETIEILKEVALGKMVQDDVEEICLYNKNCIDEETHYSTCAVTRARKVLRDNEISLQKFIALYECYPSYRRGWIASKYEVLAYSEEEANEKTQQNFSEWGYAEQEIRNLIIRCNGDVR